MEKSSESTGRKSEVSTEGSQGVPVSVLLEPKKGGLDTRSVRGTRRRGQIPVR